MAKIMGVYVKYWLLILAFLIANPVPAHAGSGEYIFILRARSNPYWQAMVDGINDAASNAGIKAKIYQTQTDIAAEEQLNICQTALAREPKVLAISAITVAVGVQCMKEAAKQGVIVADMDAGLLPEQAVKAGIPLAFTVGSDNYLIGQKAAEYLKTISKKPDPRILVLEGAPSSLQGGKRASGFKETLKTAMPQAKVIASISGEWDRLKAMNITTDTLQRNAGLDVIYAANDQMALGAAEAVRVADKEGAITIIGVDGTLDGRKAVGFGRLAATVAQLPYLIGKRSVEKAVEVVNGRKTKQAEVTPTPVIDRAFLQDKDNEYMPYVR